MDNKINNYAVIYARYSSDKQNEQSIEGQVRVIKEYAERNNINIINAYIDRALTGRSDDRPEFQKMINDAKTAAFSQVLVYKFDRFSRDRFNSLMYKKELRKYGVKVVSVTEFISDDPQGILLESIIDGYSEFYSAELAQKVRRGNRESRLKGNFTGGPVNYGYKIVDKKYVIDPEDSKIVKKIFTDVINGRQYKQICDELNEKGITHSGRPFIATYITKMIYNEKYIGRYIVNGEEYPNVIPAIISEEDFKMAQTVANKRRDKGGSYKTRNKTEYLLSGKVFCGCCGAHMCGETGSGRHGNVYTYYKCYTVKKRLGDCCKKPIKKDFLENFVIDKIKNVILERDGLKDLVKILCDAYNNFHGENTELKMNEKALEKNKKELDNTLAAVRAGIVTDSIKDMLVKLEEEKRVLETENIKLRAKGKKVINYNDCEKYLKTLIEENTDDESYNKILIDSLLRKVVVYDNKIDVYLYPVGDKSVFDLEPNGGNNNSNSNNGNGDGTNNGNSESNSGSSLMPYSDSSLIPSGSPS